MTVLPRGLIVLLAGAGVGACLGTPSGRMVAPAERVGNAIVISFEQIQGGGASLLRLVRYRVASMQVRETTGCPDVTLRGAKSIHSVSVPSVYVDGQRAANTCILEMLSPNDVHRVEVYPGGVTHRPGYHANGAGLILVFMRR